MGKILHSVQNDKTGEYSSPLRVERGRGGIQNDMMGVFIFFCEKVAIFKSLKSD